jgi:glucokinase
MQYALGIDIGGTKTAVNLACVREQHIEIIAREQFATPRDQGYLPALDRILEAVYRLLPGAGLVFADIGGIGIACGGPLDSKRGLILSPPNLPGWDDVPIVRFFQEKTGLAVTLRNDADACAYAEWQYGAGQGTENMIFLTFGTGFGAGLILGSRLYTGSSNMAGEIGHCRSALDHSVPRVSSVGYGKINSYEGFCSGGGIALLGRALVIERMQSGGKVPFCPSLEALDTLTAQSISEAAYAGDPLAKEIYRISGCHLGSALSLLVDLLNPEMIVIGSVYARSESLLREAAMEVMQKESLALSLSAVKVVPARLGDALGDIASIAIALGNC